MPYTYILKSLKDNKLYIGSAKNLRNRIRQHIEGKVSSTKNRRPLIVIGWREFCTIEEASLWEKKYKNSHGQLNRDIKNSKISLYQILDR